MTASLTVLEQAARAGNVLPAAEVLLDELESIGSLGSGQRIGEVRARIVDIVRMRAAIWQQHPETALIDFHARTLELAELDAVRQRWLTELDARGPWLRPVRPWTSDLSVVAELRSGPDLHLDWLLGLRFEDEHEVVFAHHDDDQLISWTWTRAQLERRTDLEPIPSPHEHDPRLELSESLPRYHGSPDDDDGEFLPWPDPGDAHATFGADGRTIIMFGWYDESLGLVQLVDADTLSVTRKHELEDPVKQVLTRPHSDDLLISTYGDLTILGPDGPIWTRSGAVETFAWSPSGRYVCTVSRGVARIVDTQAEAQPGRVDGMPPSFSPDGSRLVDGTLLLDGRTGSQIAQLDLLEPDHEIGHASPWHHVGTELIVCIQGGLALWATQTGESVPAGERLIVPRWERIAYSRCGRWLAFGHDQRVSIRALPSTAAVAEIAFDVPIERLALSSNATWVAAYGAGQFEVRDRSGALVCAGQTGEPQRPNRLPDPAGSLTFVDDDQRLRLHVPDVPGLPGTSGVWHLDSNPATWVGLEPGSDPTSPGWTIANGPVSVLTHASGARFVMPSEGPWVVNPIDHRLVACPGTLFELRARPR